MKIKEDDLDFFFQNGFLVLKNFINLSILDRCNKILDDWIFHLIEDWKKNGYKIPQSFSGNPNKENFLEVWRSLGSPEFRRRPNKYLINADMFSLMTECIFIDLAKILLRSDEISVHGIFNARSQLPNHFRSKTPVHQDSQYWTLDYGEGDQTSLISNHRIVTFWFPLQKVDSSSGAMQVISRREFGDKLFDNHDYDYEKTGYLGLSPSDLDKHTLIPIEINRGDLLVFDQLVPHGACENSSDHIRWSMDIRYELASTRPAIGKKYGFNIGNLAFQRETTMKEWLLKAQTN